MLILEAQHLKKYYKTKENITKALDDVSIAVNKGEFLSIIGQSGSGKTTLLNMLGGLDYPTDGYVTVNGKNVSQLKGDELTIFRRQNIGFIFQNYNLISSIDVRQNIEFPVKLDNKKVDRNYYKEIIEILGLNNKDKRYPNELSGGQQQRVAIARALITKPAIILADEPTGNLDSNTSKEVMNLLKESCAKFNQTIIMITHNILLADLSDRYIEIRDGKIVK
ncbi:MAG: ABC transporter ATP-binding protein [Clostridium sp.]